MLLQSKLEAHNPVPKAILSRFRLYLPCPSGLREDTGSIGARLDVLFFRRNFVELCVEKILHELLPF
jgi:hypothetical protein